MSKKVLINFLTYSFGAIIFRAITAIITFIAIYFLDPAEFGILSLINTFIAIVPIFLNIGLRQAFGLDFFHTDNVGRKKMLTHIIFIYLFWSLPLMILLIINAKFINRYIFFNQLSCITLLIILIICFVDFFTELFFLNLRYQTKALKLTVIQFSMGLINLFAAIALIYFLHFKINGILLANLISMLCVTAYGLYLYYIKVGDFNFKIINKDKIYYYLKLGFPFIPNVLFTWILNFSDRWILAKYLTLADVGIYSLADSFGYLFKTVVIIPLTGSYLPYIFEQFSKNKDKIFDIDKWNKRNMYLCMVFMTLLVTIGYFSCKTLFYHLFPEKYHSAANYILFILLGEIIFMGSYFATAYLVFLKRTYFLVSFTVIAAAFNIFLNLLLVPKIGIVGSVTATFIAHLIYLLSIILVTRIVKKKNNS